MLTGKKRKFANLVAETLSSGEKPVISECAVQAGYSEATARQTSSRLMKDKDVKRYIDNFNPNAEKQVDQGLDKVVKSIEDKMPDDAPKAEEFDDPMAYLVNMMNRMRHEDPKLGMDCAKALMPYKHARKGEQGVKKTREEKAKEAASVSRFKPRAV